MIRRLKLENYRSFESYKLEDLARVNLLVGPNNCGKTSILEAAHFLAVQGDPRALVHSTYRRGEVLPSRSHDGTEDHRTREPYDLSHQFHGHRFDVGTSFQISSDDELGNVAVTIRQAEDGQAEDLFNIETGRTQSLVLRIESPSQGNFDLAVNDDGSFTWNPRALRKAAANAPTATRPVQFLEVDSLEPRLMASMWDNVLVDGRETEVLHAMRILESELSSIHFLSGDRVHRFKGSPGIVLGFSGQKRRVPLGSYGDGIRRLLGLSLSLTQLQHGLLLADEIDTGLHWKVMEDMWRLVVETACDASIQVFATTHSYDCVRGLDSLLGANPELADHVCIQKIERSLDQAVAFDADRIRAAVKHGIELR